MYENESNEPVESGDFTENENVATSQESEETSSSEENSGKNDAEIEKLKNDLEDQKDKYVRLFAEFDNFKRRTSKENIELRQTAGREVITSLLDVLDDMDRAEEQMEKTEGDQVFKEGTLLIFNKLRKALESKGLKSVESLHTEFDVSRDEAISEVPVDDKKLKGKVVAEIQKAYLLNDKLIRFAKVVVGK